ncbi:hypothetical protein D3C81_2109650 [compost metagenome]
MILHCETCLFLRTGLDRLGDLAMLDIGSFTTTGHQIDEFRLARKGHAGICNDFCKHRIA